MKHSAHIGSFEVQRRIFGSRSTYLATKKGQRFAVKTYLTKLDAKELDSLSTTLSRRSLQSDRICNVFEVGIESELVYVAAPFLDGYNLHQCMKAIGNNRELVQREQHQNVCCWLIAQLARAGLERESSTFNTGLFDDEGVSPEEWFVTEEGQVVMLDARWTRLRRIARGPETHSLAHMVAYSMPSSWRDRDVQPRAMLFALTTMLWEMLSGYRLFRRESLVATLHCLSDRSIPQLSELNPSIPEPLSAFVIKSLAQYPEQSLSEFATTLEAYSGLDARSAPRALCAWLSNMFPARYIEGNDLPESRALERFLQERGRNFLAVDESTTFVAAPPSLALAPLENLEWLEDCDLPELVSTTPVAYHHVGIAESKKVLERTSLVSTAMIACAFCVGMGISLISRSMSHTQTELNADHLGHRLVPEARRIEIADYGLLTLSSIASEPNDAPSAIELDELDELDAFQEPLLQAPAPLHPARTAQHESFEPMLSANPQLGPLRSAPTRALNRSDVLFLLPPGIQATLDGQILGSGAFRAQMPQGRAEFILTHQGIPISSIETYVRSEGINIVDVSQNPTLLARTSAPLTSHN